MLGSTAGIRRCLSDRGSYSSSRATVSPARKTLLEQLASPGVRCREVSTFPSTISRTARKWLYCAQTYYTAPRVYSTPEILLRRDRVGCGRCPLVLSTFSLPVTLNQVRFLCTGSKVARNNCARGGGARLRSNH